MELRHYTSRDNDLLSGWLRSHHMDHISCIEDLPQFGFVVGDTAAGFLRMCEGHTAFIDGYIVNPDKSSQERHEALDLLTSMLIEYAKTLKLKSILAFSTNSGIIERATKHGFVLLPHSFIVWKEREG